MNCIKPYLLDSHTWNFGPVFEVEVKFRERSLLELDPKLCDQFLDAMAIQGMVDKVNGMRTGERLRDWRRAECCFGLWYLEPDKVVGVKLIPSECKHFDFILAIPPYHIDKEVGGYPWNMSTAWVTQPVVDLHLGIIKAMRAGHIVIPIQAVLMQDESWTHSLRASDSGILISKDVAVTGKFQGEAKECLFRVSLSS